MVGVLASQRSTGFIPKKKFQPHFVGCISVVEDQFPVLKVTGSNPVSLDAFCLMKECRILCGISLTWDGIARDKVMPDGLRFEGMVTILNLVMY